MFKFQMKKLVNELGLQDLDWHSGCWSHDCQLSLMPTFVKKDFNFFMHFYFCNFFSFFVSFLLIIYIGQALSHIFRFDRRSNYEFLWPNQLMKKFFGHIHIRSYSFTRPAQLGGVPARTQASQAGSVEQTEAVQLAEKNFHRLI